MDNAGELIKVIRKDFVKGELMEDQVDKDPLKQFHLWLLEALAGNAMANAMIVSTVAGNGWPSSRVMLLRNADEKGFTFYTNSKSKKGDDLETNPKASLLFFWPEMERQVRVQGDVSFQSDTDSDGYFASRPRESQLGSWASEQSHVVKDRAELDRKFDQQKVRFQDQVVPRPPHWCGYVLKPCVIEFWQGRTGRLHDRLQFTREGTGRWRLERLMP
jgi:pyridoxamine 5'-phosphate oxidase